MTVLDKAVCLAPTEWIAAQRASADVSNARQDFFFTIILFASNELRDEWLLRWREVICIEVNQLVEAGAQGNKVPSNLHQHLWDVFRAAKILLWAVELWMTRTSITA